MSTKIKQPAAPKIAVAAPKGKNGKTPKTAAPLPPAPVPDAEENKGIYREIPEELIDYSPLNYRIFIDPEELAEMTESVKVHDIIQPVTVRVVVEGRYELCFGEMRLRAGRAAGLTTIRSFIRELTDQEVIEKQVVENIQRVNPHAMEEATAIGKLIALRKTADEIAASFGKKSKSFVYERQKLLKLIPDLQVMFRANRFTIEEAGKLAALHADSQTDFFTKYHSNWKEKPHRPYHNFQGVVDSYVCSLQKAPFDINDAALLPEKGACTTCPFNSANVGDLFGGVVDGKTHCMRRTCFVEKKVKQFANQLEVMITQNALVNIISDHEMTGELKEALDLIPGTDQMKVYKTVEITLYHAPTPPTKEEYTEVRYGKPETDENDDTDDDYTDEEIANEYGFEDDDDDDEDDEYNNDDDDEDNIDDYSDEEEDDEEPVRKDAQGNELEKIIEFDEPGYNLALQEYEQDSATYAEYLALPDTLKGLRISYGQAVSVVYFKPEPRHRYESSQPEQVATAKEVQEAIKAGTATPELLEGEITRLDTREHRSKELDQEKIQVNVHAAFTAFHEAPKGPFSLTEADQVALLCLAYGQLKWSNKEEVDQYLFPIGEGEEETRLTPQAYYERMANLSDDKKAFLIRAVWLENGSTKMGNSAAGYLLRKMAEPWIDLPAIIAAQQVKADQRAENVNTKKIALQKRLRKMRPGTETGVPVWVEDYAVADCATVEDFFTKYRHPETLQSRGQAYADDLLQQHRKDIAEKGYTALVGDENVTGKYVAFIPAA